MFIPPKTCAIASLLMGPSTVGGETFGQNLQLLVAPVLLPSLQCQVLILVSFDPC